MKSLGLFVFIVKDGDVFLGKNIYKDMTII